jgi:hypothetical protein
VVFTDQAVISTLILQRQSATIMELKLIEPLSISKAASLQ